MDHEIEERELPDHPSTGQGQVHQDEPQFTSFATTNVVAPQADPTFYGFHQVGNPPLMAGPGHSALVHNQASYHYPPSQVVNPNNPHAYFHSRDAAGFSVPYFGYNNTYPGSGYAASFPYPFPGMYPVEAGYATAPIGLNNQGIYQPTGMHTEFGRHQVAPGYGIHHSLPQSEHLGKGNAEQSIRKRGAQAEIASIANVKRPNTGDNTDSEKEPAYQIKGPNISVKGTPDLPPRSLPATASPPQLPLTEEDMEAALTLLDMSRGTYRTAKNPHRQAKIAQTEASHQEKLDTGLAHKADKVGTENKEDTFIAALTKALLVLSKDHPSEYDSFMPHSPRKPAPPCNSPITPPKISKTTGKAFSNQKTVRDTPRKRAPAKGFNYIEGYPLPSCWTDASDADKTLWNMRAAGKDWAAIRIAWTDMTGQSTAASTLPNRFKRLQAAFESLKEGDDVRVLQAKKEVDQEWEAEKWGRVALAVEKRGGAKYAPEFVKREFTRLNAASGGYLGP